jgi:hypothetical protein
MPPRRRTPKPINAEVTAMQYKTIILELIQSQTKLHDRLCLDRQLLSTVNSYAVDLKASHEEWKDRLSQSRPNSDPSQIAAEAMELAIEELSARMPSESLKGEAEPMPLDAAMSYIRRHTPPA